MASIDEILAAMPEPETEGDHEYLVIDPATRSITVPEAEQVFGVTGDARGDRKYFICPRIVGAGLDLADMFLRVNFRNANSEEDGYLVDDVAVEGEHVTFSWLLSPKATAYMGSVQFSVCSSLTEDGGIDWNTTLASGDVLEGLHPDAGDGVEEQVSDVVTQLRAEIKAGTAAVKKEVQDAAAAATVDAQAQIEAKGKATLATIPADYSAMGAKVSESANAIKGSLSGAVIWADDVSPVEHFLAVKVHGKNIDPAGVTVTRCGKNLIDYKKPVLSYSIESTEINNGLHLAGRYMASFPVSIPAGTAVTMSWNTANAEGNVVDDWRVQYADNTYSQHFKNGEAMVPQLPVARVCLYVNKGDADGAADFTNIKLERGEAVTAYEPYNGATVRPNAAGIVTDLTSLAPTMTLLTDTPGAVIECTYNRDTNAVVAEILEKIAALSG